MIGTSVPSMRLIVSSSLSARATLHPGDVILTGTPSGVGITRGRFLQSGEQLRLWIEGIGELRHGFS